MALPCLIDLPVLSPGARFGKGVMMRVCFGGFMRSRISFVSLSVCLLALAACGSTSTSTPAAGFAVYTSPDHKYQIAYPIGWQEDIFVGNPGKVAFKGPNNQNFEVSDNAGIPGTDPATLITGYCQAVQKTIKSTTLRRRRTPRRMTTPFLRLWSRASSS